MAFPIENIRCSRKLTSGFDGLCSPKQKCRAFVINFEPVPVLKPNIILIMKENRNSNIDEYIAGFPADVRNMLEKVRGVIREAAPQATETINYGIPTFQLNGNLVHFAAFKHHVGFYPTPSGIDKFREQLSMYENARGSVKFPIDREIPYALIDEIVRFRVKENLAKGKKKK